MDYKKILRSQKVRFLILKFLSFVPDSIMLRLQYRIKMGLKLNLADPKRFTEKLQWYKINHRDKLMGTCVDKYEVRGYVASKGLENALNKLYCVCNDPEEINFAELPERFVIKTTDGGGGENIFICKDKSSLDIPQLIQKLRSWKDKKNVNPGREWAYTLIKESRFIVEEYLENEVNPEAGISDFKFFCFNGKPHCIAYDIDRYIGHKRNFYDIEWNNLHVSTDCETFDDNLVPRPEGLEEMTKVAEILSKDFPFVRVDLYYIKGKVYFGELTFYPWSGYVKFSPQEFDYQLGALMTDMK
jgi:hypothetical protein